uniref:ADAM10 endopeptidase n=1 Tax=Wuchereria bancrofti TaxID=6293 RepID=A0A1I8EV72_WUCBA
TDIECILYVRYYVVVLVNCLIVYLSFSGVHPNSMCVASLLFISNILLVGGLSRFVDWYETLSYEPLAGRRKRSPDGIYAPLSLQFASHNRSFHLILRSLDESTSVFSDNFIFDVDGKGEHVPMRDFLVHGHDKNDPESTLYGSFRDGIFDGHIIYGNGESYTIDKIDRYLHWRHRPKHFHSIIYSDNSINFWKQRRKRSAVETNENCGLDHTTQQKMEILQNSVIFEDEENEQSYRDGAFDERHDSNDLLKKMTLKQLTANGFIPSEHAMSTSRQIRSFTNMFMKKKEIWMTSGMTREEIASLFYNHIKAVNQIYESTSFGGINGITFVIQRISLYTPSTCKDGKPKGVSQENPFCEENVDVSNYLNLNSRKNHSDFCLAYAFTFRDFVGGTLGLAWVASPNHNTAGGICQQYTKYSEASNFVYRSLNTGIITLVNYGNRVPNRVSQLTLAHEIGHNFGSPHDYPLDCQPGLPDGNYIMFASATSGDKKNNAQFSNCSIANITLVLTEVLQQRPVDSEATLRIGGFGNMGAGKRNCFREAKSSFCGNQVKEPGEDCDCGYNAEDCQTMKDTCCNPRQSGPASRCKRIHSAQCSPSEGPCCDATNCQPYASRKTCRAESECLKQQQCNSESPECPPSDPKENGLPCQDSTKVCNDGNCNGSVCAQVGLRDCFLTAGSPEHLCHLACEDENGTCRSSLTLPQFAIGKYKQSGRKNKPGLILLPGSPCNNYKGYCDIFRKCRSVDADGPLARLKNVIFNPKTLYEVKYWIQVNWWAVVLGGLGLLLFMTLFIKICAVHTPSTNPNKTPALNIYDTLRRPRNLIQRTSGRQAAGLSENSERVNSRAAFQPAPSAPPLPPPPTSVLVIEPPPPYTAAIPGSSIALGGPKRGHRRNRRRNDVEIRAKNRRN